MQVSPEGPRKRSRTKSEEATTTSAPAAARKPRKKKTAATAPEAATPEVVAMTSLEGPELQAAIAQTAYFIAAERNFAPGRELDDWLEAERRMLGSTAMP